MAFGASLYVLKGIFENKFRVADASCGLYLLINIIFGIVRNFGAFLLGIYFVLHV